MPTTTAASKHVKTTADLQKAIFQTKLTNDPTRAVPTAEFDRFFKLIDSVIDECSPTNIQQCRAWILDFISPSTPGIATLAAYLNHKFKTCLDLQLPNSRCPAPRRRVHILYLINDLLHSAKYHRQTPSPFPAFRDGLKQTIEDAVKSCAGGVMKGHPTTKKKLLVLLNLWQAHNYYSADLICTLREIVEERPLPTPTLHGFTGVAWHDQPAGLMVPILLRNPDAPVDTLQIRPMDVQLEQASEALKTAVDELLQTANDEHNGGDSERAVVDIDEMGHRLVGDGTRFVNYYGWSEGFCRRVMSGGAPGQGGQFGGRGTGH